MWVGELGEGVGETAIFTSGKSDDRQQHRLGKGSTNLPTTGEGEMDEVPDGDIALGLAVDEEDGDIALGLAEDVGDGDGEGSGAF